MNILLCMPRFIDTNHPGCNGGGAWGWIIEKQFKRIGWNVTCLNSFECDPVDKDLIEKQDVIMFRHSYQTEFRRYKDILSKSRKDTLIVQGYIDHSVVDKEWESFKVCKNSDVWIAQGTSDKRMAESAGFKSYIFRLPIDLSKFNSIPRINNNILYVGRFCEHKGTECLLRAFKLIRDEWPEATLTMRGEWSWGDFNGKQDPEFHKYIDRMNDLARLAGNVNIKTGWSTPESVVEEYNRCGIFVFTVSGESYGCPVDEARAAAMPVVTSKYHSIEERVENGVDAFTIGRSWRDAVNGKYMIPCPEDIAYKILLLLKNPDIAYNFGIKARKKAEVYNDQDIVMNNFCKFLIDSRNEKIKKLNEG